MFLPRNSTYVSPRFLHFKNKKYWGNYVETRVLRVIIVYNWTSTYVHYINQIDIYNIQYKYINI